MEAAALTSTIFAFMGEGRGSTAAAELLIRTANAASVEGESSGSGEPTAETADQPFSIVQASSDANRGSTISSIGQDTQMEKEGVMLAFVGNKLGEYNLRGVEAGMDMVSVSKKSGKVLNTVNRRQNRVGRSPYERRPAREKKEPGS